MMTRRPGTGRASTSSWMTFLITRNFFVQKTRFAQRLSCRSSVFIANSGMFVQLAFICRVQNILKQHCVVPCPKLCVVWFALNLRATKYIRELVLCYSQEQANEGWETLQQQVESASPDVEQPACIKQTCERHLLSYLFSFLKACYSRWTSPVKCGEELRC